MLFRLQPYTTAIETNRLAWVETTFFMEMPKSGRSNVGCCGMRPMVLGIALLIGVPAAAECGDSLLSTNKHRLQPVPYAALITTGAEQSPDLLCLSSGCRRIHFDSWNASGNSKGQPGNRGWLCFVDPGTYPFGRCVWGYPMLQAYSQGTRIEFPYTVKCASIDCVSPVFRRDIF
jgi:hypothetical protein